MVEIVEEFEKEARFQDEIEADLIRQKLEQLVKSILAQVTQRDERLQSTLIQSGSVYEGMKVHKPDEFDFMVRIDSLTNKLSLRLCENFDGYVKLVCDDERWAEFRDEGDFLSPNMLTQHFKRLVNESWREIEVPEELVIQQTNPGIIHGPWGCVYAELVGGDRILSNVMYLESHGPATTLKIVWQGGSSYRDLGISVDLTLALEYDVSGLPVQLSAVQQTVRTCRQSQVFHVVPADSEMWRISFSVVEMESISSSPEGFKTCYRVLKYVRDDISQSLGLDSTLIPSCIFKCVLLGQLFASDEHAHSWEKESCSQNIVSTLENISKGVKDRDIQSFFISGYNLLSKTDYSNRLRQFMVEDMLNRVKGLDIKHTKEEMNEVKRQIRLLQMTDILEYAISSVLQGKDPNTMWRKMFVNIEDVPVEINGDEFLNQLTDLDRIELDEDVYNRLVQMWTAIDYFFKQLIAFLPGDLKILAQKFFLRTCEKKKHLEFKHGKTSECLEQIPVHQVACQFIFEYTDEYIDEKGSTAKCYSNLLKAIPPDHISLGLLKDVAEVTVNEGSEKGYLLFKERMNQYLGMVSESVVTSVIVGYVSEVFAHGQEVLQRKLEYIKTPDPLELDLY